jgi:hypothetical protein
MTFSIVARSNDGESWGVAVAPKFLAVGNVIPAAIAGTGAVATQANAEVAWKAAALTLLDEGMSAPPDDDRIPVTAELDERARTRGHADFAACVGTENYEMRVAEDASWIDRRVLDIIRADCGKEVDAAWRSSTTPR